MPGVDEALRVNGAASLRNDEAFTSQCEVRGRFPKVVVHVAVKDAYLHCAKVVMRAELWSQEAQVERGVLPGMNEMLREQTLQTEPAEAQEAMVERHKKLLYSTT